MARLLLVALVGATMVIGLAGTIIPVLPGLGLIWGAAFVYGLVAGLGAVGWVAMALITALAAAGLVAAIRIPQRRAERQGLSGWGRLLPIVLAVVGFFVIPVVGAPVGFVAGVWIAKWSDTANPAQAWTATKAALVGLVQAAGAQLLAGLAMVVVWVGWVALG